MPEKNSTENKRTISTALIGGAIIAVLLILSTVWISHLGRSGTNDAVQSVSEMYLRELTARREQGITSRINDSVNNMKTALKLLTPNDLQRVENLSVFLERMRTIYGVNQFALVDANGQIFTPEGIAQNRDEYFFIGERIAETKIFTYDLFEKNKSVAVAIPVDNLSFQGVPIKSCFVQADIQTLLEEILLQTTNSGITFFNLYYKNGESLTDSALGNFAGGTNIIDTLDGATFDAGYSKEQVKFDFENSRGGMAAFTFQGDKALLYYRPVQNTGWILSYLIHENQIEDKLSVVNRDLRNSSIIQILFTIAAMIILFRLIISESHKNQKLLHQKNISETENRVKREEMEEKFRLQTQLLSEERRRRRQSEMIQALTADYRLVYHLNLDSDEAVCYRVEPEISTLLKRRQSDVVKFQAAMQNYVREYVAPNDREELLNFIKPENIRARLQNEEIISQRYVMFRFGEEHFMMLRVAKIDESLHAVGVGFANVDEQTRETLARNQELAEALAQARHANASKTTFLSNMSHDIRTPMNAIIGFTSMALRHFENRTQVKDSLEKVLSSSNHLLGLINDILDMSRIESGRVEVAEQECNLSDLIHNLIHIIQPQVTAKQQKFHIDAFKVKNEDVYADQLKVNQVLINILSNAVKYTPSTGSIFFRISQYESEIPGCAKYEFRIKDNGLGMSKEFLKHVFDAFEREE
ncbi:MAG: sensor histidine kinase, partial [Selenomonadaceae bacterium]|nr:sensor histidine kinase [Selenomonadaceae bacterium]